MNQSTLRERQRRKKQQMLIRRFTKLGIYLAAVVLLVVFLVKGVVLPILNRGSKDSETTETYGIVEGTAEEGSLTAEADGTADTQIQTDGSEEGAGTASGEEGISGGSEGGLSDTGASTKIVTESSGSSIFAVRMPLKGQNDLDKVTVYTPGWHESSSGKWYQNPDGTYYASGFQEINGEQYSFDENGYIQTGWITSGVHEFYFEEDGSYNPGKKKAMLALTFDDGPGQYTMDLLNCLEENNAHATFFMLGECAQYYPDEVRKMVEIGCELGNHSWDHTDQTTISLDAVAKQFGDTDETLKEACGRISTVARMPYGNGNEDVYATVGKPCFFWSLDSLDWKYRDVTLDYQEIMGGDLSDGSIILMHDIHEPSVETAKRIIPELIAQGYKLVTVSEMAEAKGVNLENTFYTDFWDSSLSAGKVAGYTGSSDLLYTGNG